MRGARFFVAALAATVGLLVTAGVGTAATSSTPDLSTVAAIDSYLVSQGLDPSTFVHQVGLKNYAGPAASCPGIDWNCTTSSRVVQLAFMGGENRAECSDDDDCEGVQSKGSTNTITCVARSSNNPDVQTCNFTQSGADRNRAFVAMTINQNGGTVQNAQQMSVVTQGPAKFGNQAEFFLLIRQTIGSNKDPDPAQDAHQHVELKQIATDWGSNWAKFHIAQNQNMSSTGSQSQNTGPLPSGFACATDTFDPSSPNACADVEQTAVNGSNAFRGLVLINERANSSGPGTQAQGGLNNGIKGDVDQTTATPNNNKSKVVATEVQQLNGNPSVTTQTQFDPITCCGISQTGGGTENTSLNSTQSANGGASYVQHLDLFGSANTTGTCTISETGQQNDVATSPTLGPVSPCPVQTLNTTCDSTGTFVSACTSCPPTCDGFAPVQQSLVMLPIAPTSGAVVAPLDVVTEPSWYTAPW